MQVYEGKEMKKAITALLLFLFGATWCYAFVMIWLTGGYTAVEPNHIILATEIILVAAGSLWGLIAFLGAFHQAGGQVSIMLAGLLLSLAALGVFEQWLTTGIVWQWGQFWHHETLVACTAVAAVAILGGYGLTRRHP